MDGERLPTLVGFAGTLVVLAALLWLVGVGEVLDVLAQARLPVAALLVPIVACWLIAWGLSLWTVLRALGARMAPHTAVLVFTAAVFSNNVTPFGQAGGEPFSALLIAHEADTEYETGLAAIASVDTLHFVPSLGLAIAGLTFVAASTLHFGRDLLFAAGAVAALAVALPIAALLAWRYRHELEAAVVRALTPLVRTFGRLFPGRSEPDGDAVAERIEGFFRAIDRIAGDRRRLLAAMGFSALGWLALSASLWVALYALGYAVPPAAVVLAVPVGSIASVTPLPGGSGAIETVLATLLVATAPVSLPVATSAVLLHRGATYLLPTLVGAGVASAIGADHAVVEE